MSGHARALLTTAATAVAVAVAACAPLPTLEEYCADTGLCRCDQGECCSVGRQACSAEMPCCAGMVCGEKGRCELDGPTPEIVLEPAALELGWLDAEGAPVSRTVTVRNVGAVATRPLAFETGGMHPDAFQVDPGSCAALALAPGASCSASVTFVADGVYQRKVSTTLFVREDDPATTSRALTEGTITAETGHDVTLTVTGTSAVLLRRENASALSAVLVEPGKSQSLWSLARWTAVVFSDGLHPTAFSPGTCSEFPCRVAVEGHVDITVEAEPNLHLDLTVGPQGTAAGVYVDVFVTTEWGSYGTRCVDRDQPWVLAFGGAVELRVLTVNGPYGGTVQWGGACASATGTVCSLQVTGRTDITLTTD